MNPADLYTVPTWVYWVVLLVACTVLFGVLGVLERRDERGRR